MKNLLNKISLLFMLLTSLLIVGCNHSDELKNDDYSFKITKNVDGVAEIFLLNQSEEKQENVRVVIYIKLLDSNEKYVFYEKTYDSLDKDQIIWDEMDYSNEEYVEKMVISDDENGGLKSNYEFIYEVYDNR